MLIRGFRLFQGSYAPFNPAFGILYFGNLRKRVEINWNVLQVLMVCRCKARDLFTPALFHLPRMMAAFQDSFFRNRGGMPSRPTA